MHKDFGEEANRIINDLQTTLETKSGQLEDAWVEIRAKDEQFRVCFAHGGSPGFPAPRYCPKCIEEQIAGLQSDYRNACEQNKRQLNALYDISKTCEIGINRPV